MWNNVNFMYFLSEMIDGKVNRQKNSNEEEKKRQKSKQKGEKRDKTTEFHHRGPLIGSQYN